MDEFLTPRREKSDSKWAAFGARIRIRFSMRSAPTTSLYRHPTQSKAACNLLLLSSESTCANTSPQCLLLVEFIAIPLGYDKSLYHLLPSRFQDLHLQHCEQARSAETQKKESNAFLHAAVVFFGLGRVSTSYKY